MVAINVEELFVKNQEREQELRTLLKTKPSESREVQALRGEIREAYSDMLGIDPDFCASKDVELLLWKNCYYKRIEDFRKRLRKYAHLASSLERTKAFEARNHLQGICQAFARFLGEATEFYSSLLRRFEAMQHQYSKGGGGGSGPDGAPVAGNSERRARLGKIVILSINRCFIFLGDLARYRELHGENSVKDWSVAERYYQQALAVLPTSGNPHNQLAVLATYTDAECVSVYRYCRSLMIESPFQTAHENLTLLFDKNKQKGFAITPGGADGLRPMGVGSGRDLAAATGGVVTGGGGQHHGKGKGKGSGGRGNTGALLKSFLRRFVRLHGMIFSGKAEDLEDFPSIFETAIADFRTLLSNSAFGDALLLKMVVICIFSVMHVAEAPPSSAASGSSSDTRSEAFSNSESAADGGGSSLDGASNAGSTGTQGGASEAAAAAASKAEEARRNARLSYPLALAFGVSAQIGRHVRTQEPTHPSQGSQHGGHGRGHHRQSNHGGQQSGDPGLMLHGHHHHHHGGYHPHHTSPPAPVVVYGVDSKSRPSSNQPQPRPLGSRLLGPVVLFCDWLTAQSQFLCIAEEERSASGGGGGRGGGISRRGIASVAVQEAEMRGQFWEVIQRLAATLPDPDPTNQADAFPGDPLGRRRPLKEHVELRGFLPLADLYKKRYAMDGPAVPAVPDDCAGSVRIRGLKAFAAAVSGEPFTPAPPLHYDGGIAFGGPGSHRSEYSGWSEPSGGSGSHLALDTGRSYEMSHRQQAPRSQQYSRAPPGIVGGGGGGGSLIGPGGERVGRAASGSSHVGGYFGSGSSSLGGSEGGSRRISKSTGPHPQQQPYHSRSASVNAIRGTGPQQQTHMASQMSHSRHAPQSMVHPVGSEVDLPGHKFFHPPVHRVHSQQSSQGFNSGRHSDTGSVTGSRHSLDSGMRYYESRPSSGGGGGVGGNTSATAAVGSFTPALQQSMASNEGSGSGSSGIGSAHDTRSIGAWSAPVGRSGGGVGNGGSGGGSSWAASGEIAEQRSNYRSDPGSLDDGEVALVNPSFGAPSRRRSTGGGGGGPVVIGVGGQDGGVGGSGGIRGDEVGGGGSDLGSSGSPQFDSRRGSGLLGGGIWGSTFTPNDLALSPQDRSEYNEDGERYESGHSLFGSSSWRGALGSGGDASNGRTPLRTPVSGNRESLVDARGSPPRASSPAGIATMVAGRAVGGDRGGSGLVSGVGDGSQLHAHHDELDRSRNMSFEQRASPESGGLGYIHGPFQASPPSQHRHEQQQVQNYDRQQRQEGFSQSSMHRREASTGSMRASRSPPFDDAISGEPPGFSGAIPESPNTAAPRSSGVGGGLPRETPTGQVVDHQRRYSMPGPPQSSGGTAPRSHHAPLGYPSHGGSQQGSPPLQPQRPRHDHAAYGRRSSSPAAASRGGPGERSNYASAGSPVLMGMSHRGPPSTLPVAFSSGTSSAVGTNNNHHTHDDASSIFSSNVSGHSTYSGFSGYSAFNAFGGSDLGSVGGGGGGRDGGGGGSGVLPWRTPPFDSSKGDLGTEDGATTGQYAAAHGSSGGALGWGTVMGTGGGGGERTVGRDAEQR